MQLVLQHSCKTSWIVMLRVLPLTFKPVNNLICSKTGLMWVVKRATSLNSFCSNVARQVAQFLVARFSVPLEPPGNIYFKHICGGLISKRWSLFNLAKLVISFIYKELDKWKNSGSRSWRSFSRRSKTTSNFQYVSKSYRTSPHEVSQSWEGNTFY